MEVFATDKRMRKGSHIHSSSRNTDVFVVVIFCLEGLKRCGRLRVTCADGTLEGAAAGQVECPKSGSLSVYFNYGERPLNEEFCLRFGHLGMIDAHRRQKAGVFQHVITRSPIFQYLRSLNSRCFIVPRRRISGLKVTTPTLPRKEETG